MLATDKQAVRALLLSICNRSYACVSGEFDAQGILTDVLCEAQSTLADFAYSLNQKRTCCRLPTEILGLCLSHLPFRYRVQVSRISRAWRAAALALPSLWADICDLSWGPQLTAPVLELALSRAGAVPLSLEFHRELKSDVIELAQRSMNRVVYLHLSRVASSALLDQPAPLLRTLHLEGVAELTKDFLSGCPGSLATLQAEKLLLPDSCRGLSNLTTLIAGRCGTATLRDIFALCPRLQKLEVTNVIARNVEAPGFPPQSLADLTIGTVESHAQLLPLLPAYRTASNLTHVELRYGCAFPGCVDRCYTDGCAADDLALALHGIVNLRMDFAFPALYIEASYPGGRRLDLWLYHMLKLDWLEGFSPVFKQHVDCFANLRALTMPIFALEAFVSNAPPVPGLEDLIVYVSEDFKFRGGVAMEWYDAEYPWHLLRYLARVTQRRVELNVMPHPQYHGPPRPPTLPTADEARALVAELADLVGPLELRVIGFAPDTVPRDCTLNPGVDLVFVPSSDAPAPQFAV